MRLMCKFFSFPLATTLFVAILAQGTARAAIVDGLVAYWPLDIDFNDAFSDYHGEGFGTDDIVFEDGKLGKGIVLDGEDQFVEITGGDEDGLDFVDLPMSISAWFRVDAFDTSWQALIAKGEQDSWRLHRRNATGGMAFNGGGPDTPDTGTPIDDGEIHHVVATTEDGFKTLWIDGEIVAEAEANVIGAPTTNLPVRIGDNPSTSNREWEGLIDDVAIWGRALNEDEVGMIYNGGAGASIGSLIGGGVGSDGDFDNSGILDVADANLLTAASASGANDLTFDLTADGAVDSADVTKWIKDLANSYIGDSNVDGEFNSSDFVQVFQAGLFETNNPANWGQGDWNGDGVFSSSDFVLAFQDGGFELGPRAAATASVPEPTGLITLIVCLALPVLRRRRK